MKIKLGISPCPNDTFMFYHLLNSNQFQIELTVAEVEELNQKVLKHELDISKVSFFTAMQVMEYYDLLDTGAALGKNCGPLLVTKRVNRQKRLKDATIGIPGPSTTAHLLFNLYAGHQGRKVFMAFHKIMPAVKEGQLDFGVIIHEGRFTYQHYQLTQVVDLGQWWENLSGMPLPLGGIVAKKEMTGSFIRDFTQALVNSIRRAFTEKEDQEAPIYAYIRENAQEMDGEIIRKHIDLYVNDYSLSLGTKGRAAVEKLFAMGKEFT